MFSGKQVMGVLCSHVQAVVIPCEGLPTAEVAHITIWKQSGVSAAQQAESMSTRLTVNWPSMSLALRALADEIAGIIAAMEAERISSAPGGSAASRDRNIKAAVDRVKAVAKERC